MDLKARADLVRACRIEIKQRRTGAPRDVDAETQRQRNATRWLGTLDRRAPRVSRSTTDAERNTLPARSRAYQNDRSRNGGYALGERLRTMREGGGFGVDRSSEAHARLARRSNVRLIGRTGFSGPDGIERVLTPSERINAVGTRSRRRRVSPGLVPPPRR